LIKVPLDDWYSGVPSTHQAPAQGSAPLVEEHSVAAHVEQVILPVFRLDTETLLDLDAILRDRLRDISSNATLEYEVSRQDGLRYATSDASSIIRERNGRTSRIVSIEAKADDSPNVKLSLLFRDVAQLNLGGDDRAKIALLATDMRSLLRERSAVRVLVPKGWALYPLACVVWILSTIGYLTLDAMRDAQVEQRHEAQVAAYQAESARLSKEDERLEAEEAKVEADAAKRDAEVARQGQRQAEQVMRSGDILAKINFLISREIASLRESEEYFSSQANANSADDAQAAPSREYPVYPERGPYRDILPLAVPTGFTFAIVGILWLMGRRRSIFMIGDQIVDETRRRTLYDRILWGGIGALLLGIVSSVIASQFFGA
jgi:hypothetical protein